MTSNWKNTTKYKKDYKMRNVSIIENDSSLKTPAPSETSADR